MEKIQFKRQFRPSDVVSHHIQCEGPEGFVPGQAEPISRLMQRLGVGQSVDVLEDGCYEDDQVFDTQFVEVFDFMDKSDELARAILEQKRKAGAKPKPAHVPPEGEPATPPPSA